MKPLTESEFHSVWTESVGMEGYNKKLFQNLLKKMTANGTVKKFSQCNVSDSLPVCECTDYSHLISPSTGMDVFVCKKCNKDLTNCISGNEPLTVILTNKKIEKLYKAIDALIDVADDVNFNSHEIKNVWIEKLRSEINKLEN